MEDEEVAILERVRAFGFSSNAGVIRPANPAWSGHSARLAADGQAEAEESRVKFWSDFSLQEAGSLQTFPRKVIKVVCH